MTTTLDALLEQLQLKNARHAWGALCARAAREQWSHELLLETLLTEEVAQRRRMHRGDNAVARDPTVRASRPEHPLSDRERDVVQHARLGLHTKAIAYELGIADSTVRVLLRRAAIKLGARSREELLAKEGSRGL